MSVRIRLTRTGKKHQISYRIVATDTRNKRDGKFLEILGYYIPHPKPQLKFKEDRINFWISKGAKPSWTVSKLITNKNMVGISSSAVNGSKSHIESTKT